MATIVLSAVGAAVGGSIGGGILGLSSAVIGRAAGATVGRLIDQRLLGAGSPAVETGRVERFRLNGASEGTEVGLVFGRMRTGGQVIWASRFDERSETSGGGGKGAPSTPRTTSYSYSVSLAIALCEGPIARVGRIWADGTEIARDEIDLRVYLGDELQLPDPKIEAVEGAGNAPSYRGIAYVVIEDLELGPYGNRVPQFSFEVIRPEPAGLGETLDLSRAVRGVAMMPGTGEYALATTPVHFSEAPGVNRSANVNTSGGLTDFTVSLDTLREEIPDCGSVSLIVSWFGDDLRCGSCAVQPKVEQQALDGAGMPWRVSGLGRSEVGVIGQVDGRPVYGGTPTDASVRQAIQRMNGLGLDVMFYPFLLMELLPGNGRPDPWSDAPDQPELPWRGRITTSIAPGRAASPDGGAAAVDEVAAFFGAADRDDFLVTASSVEYTGPAELSYRRFILHYAHLCKAAGGVESFCIGSEMRSLTQIRGPGDSFPAVDAMRQLAADVRAILGPGTKIGYAADWSEYFGYHPQDGSGDVFFHLDPLWADANIDFVGIDNYMPLSDWRDGTEHADAGWGSIYNLDYLRSNVAGGEGYEWYYHAPEAAEIQLRTPITDGAYGEPWVFRYKDLRSWWSERHHNRPGGVRDANATDWVPMSKPFRFTEYGCAAVDKGSNEPNKFLDPKSSESAVPKYSNGARDDLIQMQYLRAVASFWEEPENNPTSPVYGGPMVDMEHGYVWAWDARPYPHFPTRRDLWSDGANYARGHWISGRATLRSLASVVAEICERAELKDYDVSELWGVVRGYHPSGGSDARSLLQPLMLAYGFDAIERDGRLVFRTRGVSVPAPLLTDELAVSEEVPGDISVTRASDEEIAGRIQLTHVEADGDFDLRVAEASVPDRTLLAAARSELPLALTRSEARGIVERWLAESRVARDRVRFALPPKSIPLGAGDLVEVPGAGVFRIDGIEETDIRTVEGSRVERGIYEPVDVGDAPARLRGYVPPLPVEPVFLDLPLLSGDEDPIAPHLAVTADPWPDAAVYTALPGQDFQLDRVIRSPSVMGETEAPLASARHGVWDLGAPLRVRLFGGALSSASRDAVLAGANAMAIGDGISDLWEVFQFADATLVEEGVYELSTRLRGQAGTDALVPPVWPVGSRVVLLDASLTQISLPGSLRGVSRSYRIGPARRRPSDPSYREFERVFRGVGLRPYAPTHLRAVRDPDGAGLTVTWVRRTRIDGDVWEVPEVPLGEASERYLVRVLGAGGPVREADVSSPLWRYEALEQVADGVTGGFSIQVAQVSDRFGPGPFRRIDIND